MPDDGPPVAISQAAAGRFVEKMTAAGERAAEGGGLKVTFTQEEVTSFLSFGTMIAQQMQAMNVGSLEELEQAGGFQGLEGAENQELLRMLLRQREGMPQLDLSRLTRLTISEPQVYFKGNGHIVVRGYAEALGQRQPLRLVLAPKASQGQLSLDFVEGKLGPVDVPEALIDQIGQGLASLILAGQDYVEITQIAVGDGTLTLSGRYLQ
jgi:hypothetical protein